MEILFSARVDGIRYFRVATTIAARPEIRHLLKALGLTFSGKRVILRVVPHLWESDPTGKGIWHGMVIPVGRCETLGKDLEILERLEKEARFIHWESFQHGQPVTAPRDLLFRLEAILPDGLSLWRVHPSLIAPLHGLIEMRLLDGEFPMRTDTALLTIAKGNVSGYSLNELQGGWKWIIADPDDQEDEPLLVIHDLPGDPVRVHLHFGKKWTSIAEVAAQIVSKK